MLRERDGVRGHVQERAEGKAFERIGPSEAEKANGGGGGGGGEGS